MGNPCAIACTRMLKPKATLRLSAARNKGPAPRHAGKHGSSPPKHAIGGGGAAMTVAAMPSSRLSASGSRPLTLALCASLKDPLMLLYMETASNTKTSELAPMSTAPHRSSCTGVRCEHRPSSKKSIPVM